MILDPPDGVGHVRSRVSSLLEPVSRNLPGLVIPFLP